VIPPARAGFEITSHAVEVDAAAQQNAFTLTFNQRPDFFSLDEVGRPVHAFQYFYDSARETSDFRAADSVTVIRGSEIHFQNNIPIRASINASAEENPRAEGWGAVRLSVPYVLEGQTLSFSAPWSALAEDDGRFSYQVLAFEEGSLTNALEQTTAIPLPRPLATGIAGLSALAVWKVSRRWFHRHIAARKKPTDSQG
jgi:hypothetical protein